MRSDLLVEVRRDSFETFIRKESHTMNFDRASWIVRGARPFLAALAILSVLGLATPSASASLSVSFSATDVGTSATTGVIGLGTGGSDSFTLGNFGTLGTPVQVTVSPFETSLPYNLSQLTTTNISLNNTSSTTDTLKILVTGVGFSLNGTATAGEAVLANFSVSGTAGPYVVGTDSTTGSSWAGLSNTAFGTDTPFGSQTTTPITTTPAGLPTTSYANASSPLWGFNLAQSTFSLTQELLITLGAGDKANLTITTSLYPGEGGQSIVPEPSTLAIAGLGALGMIGYGLRRRKAQGA
jgi:hypothetical protein